MALRMMITAALQMILLHLCASVDPLKCTSQMTECANTHSGQSLCVCVQQLAICGDGKNCDEVRDAAKGLKCWVPECGLTTTSTTTTTTSTTSTTTTSTTTTPTTTTPTPKTTTPTPRPTKPPRKDFLVIGERLCVKISENTNCVGNKIVSQNGKAILTIQPEDGNVCLYDTSATPYILSSKKKGLWCTYTQNRDARFAMMESDGNFVVRSYSKLLYSTNRYNLNHDAKLVVQNDYNLVLYSTVVTWQQGATQTPPNSCPKVKRPSQLRINQHLCLDCQVFKSDKRCVGSQLVSSNGCYRLVLQPDSNLCVYENWRRTGALWCAMSQHHDVKMAVVQGDGNFVLYHNDMTPFWDTKTYGKGRNAHLVLHDDGTVKVYYLSAPWATMTNRKKSALAISLLAKSSNQTANSDGPTFFMETGDRLYESQLLLSKNLKFLLSVSPGGNLALSFKNRNNTIWETRTTANARFIELLDNGSVALIRADGEAEWASGSNCTAGQAPCKLTIEEDGDLVSRCGGRLCWHSHTAGKALQLHHNATANGTAKATIAPGIRSTLFPTALPGH